LSAEAEEAALLARNAVYRRQPSRREAPTWQSIANNDNKINYGLLRFARNDKILQIT